MSQWLLWVVGSEGVVEVEVEGLVLWVVVWGGLVAVGGGVSMCG